MIMILNNDCVFHTITLGMGAANVCSLTALNKFVTNISFESVR